MQLSVHAYTSGTKGCSPLNAEIDAGSCGRKLSERGQRGACAMVQKGDADVANCGSVPLNTIINSSLNRSWVSLSTSSTQPSVFQTLSSSSTGPERITKSSSRFFCFSMKRLSFLTHVAHRTLLCALGFSLLFGPSSAFLGLQISRFQRRRPLVEQLALHLTYVGLLPNYQEDEAMIRGILEDSGRSPFAEKLTRIVVFFLVLSSTFRLHSRGLSVGGRQLLQSRYTRDDRRDRVDNFFLTSVG